MGFKWWRFKVKQPPKPINVNPKDLIKLVDKAIVAKLKSVTASDTIKLSDNTTLQTIAGGLIKPSIGILGYGINMATGLGNTSHGVLATNSLGYTADANNGINVTKNFGYLGSGLTISKSVGLTGFGALITKGIGYATNITLPSGGG